MSSERANSDTMPIPALEEQLFRQKSILANKKLIQKLSDKGAKLRESVSKIEAELERRKQSIRRNEAPMSDIGKLEWTLATHSGWKTQEMNNSDDDGNVQLVDPEKNALEIIASSQITQREPKPSFIVDASSVNPSVSTSNFDREVRNVRLKKNSMPDRYVVKLIEKDVRKSEHPVNKFSPARTLNNQLSDANRCRDNSKPVVSTSVLRHKEESSEKKVLTKWDECLQAPAHSYETTKFLSMEETIKISCDKYQQIEAMASEAQNNKLYAHHKLKAHGSLDSRYNVHMLTPRPMKINDEDDNFDEDLSDDQISEESEPNDVDDDGESSINQGDLSNLVNTSLKLS